MENRGVRHRSSKGIPGTKNTVCYYKKNVGFYGSLYNTDNIFKTREAAQRWIYERIVTKEELFYIDMAK